MVDANLKLLTDTTDIRRSHLAYGPLLLGQKFNTAVTANTAIFSSALDTFLEPATVSIYACFSAAVVLTLERTFSAVTVAEKLNSGNALVAGSAYIFDIIVDVGETINLKVDVNTTALKLSVVENVDYAS